MKTRPQDGPRKRRTAKSGIFRAISGKISERASIQLDRDFPGFAGLQEHLLESLKLLPAVVEGSHQESPAQNAGSFFSFRAASGKTLDIPSMVKRSVIESQEWYLSVLTNNINAAHYLVTFRGFSRASHGFTCFNPLR